MSTTNITLCCVDTVVYPLSVVALRRCNQVMPFAKTIFVTDRPEFLDAGWEHHRIKAFAGFDDYNRFMLKGLFFHIETDFALSVQFDGFILNPAAWSDDFLTYDYIGAPWPFTPRGYAVGTGGFSLRSKRLLEALQDDRIILGSDPEDICICRTYRSYLEVKYGIRFAPLEVAERFCYESGPFVGDTFGFHGLSRLADFYTGETAPFLIDNLPAYNMRRVGAVELALQYAFRQQHEEAQRLFDRIAEHQTYERAREMLVAGAAPVETVTFLDKCWPRYVLHRTA